MRVHLALLASCLAFAALSVQTSAEPVMSRNTLCGRIGRLLRNSLSLTPSLAQQKDMDNAMHRNYNELTRLVEVEYTNAASHQDPAKHPTLSQEEVLESALLQVAYMAQRDGSEWYLPWFKERYQDPPAWAKAPGSQPKKLNSALEHIVRDTVENKKSLRVGTFPKAINQKLTAILRRIQLARKLGWSEPPKGFDVALRDAIGKLSSEYNGATHLSDTFLSDLFRSFYFGGLSEREIMWRDTSLRPNTVGAQKVPVHTSQHEVNLFSEYQPYRDILKKHLYQVLGPPPSTRSAAK